MEGAAAARREGAAEARPGARLRGGQGANIVKPSKVTRKLKDQKAAELLRRAEDAKRRSEESEGQEQLVQLRRMEDFKKLAAEAEH
jgi:hypothetical protein